MDHKAGSNLQSNHIADQLLPSALQYLYPAGNHLSTLRKREEEERRGGVRRGEGRGEEKRERRREERGRGGVRRGKTIGEERGEDKGREVKK